LSVLLNSYLDGELSTAKNQKVERLLAEDEHARELLSGLCMVSEKVGSLPRSKAPTDIAEAVLQDIERDILLDQRDSLAEEAGRKHLRMRQFLEAAAMIVLTVAMVIIVYNVLKDSESGDPGPGKPAVAPEIVIRTPKSAKKNIGRDKTLQQIPAGAGEVEDEPEEIIPVPDIKCSSVEMVVEIRTDFEPWAHMEQMLTNRQIGRVLQAKLNPNQRQYVFLCSVEQFGGVFDDLISDTTVAGSLTTPAKNNLLNIKMTVADRNSGQSVTVSDVTSAQAKMLASEANAKVQLADAMVFSPKEQITLHQKSPDVPAELPVELPTELPAETVPISQKAQLVAVKLILKKTPPTNHAEKDDSDPNPAGNEVDYNGL